MVRNDYPVDIAAKVISGGFCYVLQIQRLRGRWAEFASFQICWIESRLSLTLWKFPHTNINTICIFFIAILLCRPVVTHSVDQSLAHTVSYNEMEKATGAQTLICSFKKKLQYYCVHHCFSQTEKNLIKQLEDKHYESNNLFVKLKIKLTFTKYRRTAIIDSAGTVEFCPRVSRVAFLFLPLCDFQPFFCAHLLVNQHLCVHNLLCSPQPGAVPSFVSPGMFLFFLFLAYRFLSLTPLPVCSLLSCCNNLFLEFCASWRSDFSLILQLSFCSQSHLLPAS